jgi:hypothetical protein
MYLLRGNARLMFPRSLSRRNLVDRGDQALCHASLPAENTAAPGLQPLSSMKPAWIWCGTACWDGKEMVLDEMVLLVVMLLLEGLDEHGHTRSRAQWRGPGMLNEGLQRVERGNPNQAK